MTRVWMLVLTATALAGAPAAYAASASVAMREAAFQPASVTVNVGDSVTWTNFDGIPHSARGDGGSFDTGVFSTGSRTVAFTAAGTFGYFCAVHPSTMRGTVRVLGQATPAPTPPPLTPVPTVAPTPPPTPVPTPRPTAAPTVAPTVPATPSPTPSPIPSPTPTPPSPSPTATGAPPTIAPTNSPAATASAAVAATSRTGDGPPILLIGLVGVALVLGMVLAWKRGS